MRTRGQVERGEVGGCKGQTTESGDDDREQKGARRQKLEEKVTSEN